MADRMIPLPTQSAVSAISPSTQVILAEGVAFSPDYTHVRLFSGKSAVLSYVQSKAVKTITQSTPVRWGSFQYRANDNQTDIKRCNYMAFKNPGDEWTYAFITGINWISENSATISYALDVFQNNYYDCKWKACYVEREHCSSSEDSVDFNLVPENIETGDMTLNHVDTTSLGDMVYVMLVSSDTDGNPPPSSGAYGGLYTGLGVIFGTESLFNQAVQEYQQAGMADAIVAIYSVPNTIPLNPGGTETTASSNMPSTIDGYTPKNKKLLQYPYNYCLVTSYQGDQMILKYELSDNADHSITVGWNGTAIPMPVVRVYAKNYNGVPQNNVVAYEINGFPQGAWINDGFQAYMVQNQPIWHAAVERLNYTNKKAVESGQRNLGSQVIGALGNAMSQNYLGTAQGAAGIYTSVMDLESSIDVSQFNLVSEINAQILAHDLIPPTMKGTTSSPIINTVMNLNVVSRQNYCVKAQMAKVIDDFWSVYGYPEHRIKIPNTNNRSAWNYVKTVGCALSGAVMPGELQALRNIFDRGVTLWHTDDIGNYSLSNT